MEVDDDEPGIQRAARTDDLIVKAKMNMDSALDGVRALAAATLGKLQVLGPEDIEVEFGIRLNATAGAVIAKTDTEGHLKVRLTWTKAPRR